MNLSDLATVQVVRDTIERTAEPVLKFILDTWARMVEGNENSTEDTRRNLKPVQAFVNDFDLGVVVIHHDNKSGDGRAGNRLRGSGAFYAATDSVWQFERDVTDGIGQPSGRLTIEPKNASGERIRFAWDPATFLVESADGDSVTVNPVALADAAERLDAKRVGLSSEQLRVEFAGVRDTTWKARLRDAVKSGALTAIGKGRATRYLWPEPDMEGLAARFQP